MREKGFVFEINFTKAKNGDISRNSIAEFMILLLFNRFCASFQDIFERSKSHLKKVKGSLPLKVLQENECVDLCQIYEGLKGSDQIK